MLPCYLQLHIIGTIFKSRVGDIREAHVILRSWCVPYQLVANNRSFSSCPFGLDLTGRTWLVSFLWSRVQNLHGTLGRCLFGAFPEVAKPIFASPPVSPPAKKAKTKVVKYPYCMYLAILSQQNGQDLLPNYLVNSFRLSSTRKLPKQKGG